MQKSKANQMNFYNESYSKIVSSIIEDIKPLIDVEINELLKNRQNMSIIRGYSEHIPNLSIAIKIFINSIDRIFEILFDFYNKMNYQDNIFLFLVYMSRSSNFPMEDYFSDFELSRLTISSSGLLKIRKSNEEFMIIGGFIIVRILLHKIIFENYKLNKKNNLLEWDQNM